MAKEKRSFFEKLTGAVRVEDDLEPTPRKGARASEERAEEKAREEWSEESAEGQLPVDVFQTPTDIFIKTLIPGTKVDDLDISITRDMVTIKGKREATREIAEDDYFFRELYWGSFSRTILLPQEIDVEGADASEKLGLLTIRLPKIDKSRQTKLKVKSGN